MSSAGPIAPEIPSLDVWVRYYRRDQEMIGNSGWEREREVPLIWGLFNGGVSTRWWVENSIFHHQVVICYALISPHHLVVTPRLNSPLHQGRTDGRGKSHMWREDCPLLNSFSSVLHSSWAAFGLGGMHLLAMVPGVWIWIHYFIYKKLGLHRKLLYGWTVEWIVFFPCLMYLLCARASDWRVGKAPPSH